MAVNIPKQLKNLKFCRVRKQSKKPFENDWNNKPYSYVEISKFENENYGVLCGYENLAVIDCDEESLAVAVEEILPKTFSVKTGGGGTHFYYLIKELKQKIILNAEGKHLGEVQSAGAQVVGPGSIHPNNKTYEIIDNVGIKEISLKELYSVIKPFMKTENNNLNEKGKTDEYKNLIFEISKKWNEGDRQELALSTAGYLRKEKRLGINKTKEIVKEVCRICNDEELTMRLRAVDETYKKDEKDIKGIKGFLEFGIEEKKKAGVKNNCILVEDFLFTDDKGKERISIDKVADYIENKFNIRTIFGIKEETIEIYQEGIWIVKGKGIIKAEIERLLRVYSKNNIVSEVFEKIKRRTEISREETEKIPDFKRCLSNGVLDFEDVDNIKIIPHSKEYNFRTKWDIEYNPKIKCGKYLEIIKKTLYEEDLLRFQEWNGFHLRKRYFLKKFVIYHGPKDTAKTLFMNHLTISLNKNVSGLSLQEISRGKPFDLLVLKDKDANICDDLSSSDMKAIGGIKKSVGDGFIDGEYKFGDKIKFPNTAKQTYACNKIPNSGEDIDDEAYYGRIILFPFDTVIPKSEQNQNLIKEITTPKELSGWLNWIIEGYKSLIKNNGFNNEKDAEETKFLMIKGGNSLAEFSADVLVEEAGAKITKNNLYKIYCRWCLDHKPKLSPDSKDKIGKTLIRFNPYVSSEKSGAERYWLNVKLKDKWDTFLNNMSEYKSNDNDDVNNNTYNISKPVSPVPKTQIDSPKKPQKEPKEWSDEDKKRLELANKTEEKVK